VEALMGAFVVDTVEDVIALPEVTVPSDTVRVGIALLMLTPLVLGVLLCKEGGFGGSVPSTVFVRLLGKIGGNSLPKVVVVLALVATTVLAGSAILLVVSSVDADNPARDCVLDVDDGEGCGVGDDCSSLCTECVRSSEDTVEVSMSRLN